MKITIILWNVASQEKKEKEKEKAQTLLERTKNARIARLVKLR